MILAIRAFRATIFAFNASIWVSRAVVSEVTVAPAEIDAPATATSGFTVAFTVNAPELAGANCLNVATPPTNVMSSVGTVPVTVFE